MACWADKMATALAGTMPKVNTDAADAPDATDDSERFVEGAGVERLNLDGVVRWQTLPREFGPPSGARANGQRAARGADRPASLVDDAYIPHVRCAPDVNRRRRRRHDAL